MPEPLEGTHTPREVDGRQFDIWPLIWRSGDVSWEVSDVASDTLLTMDGSLDDTPTDDDLRALCEHLLCKTCDAPVFATSDALREHLEGHHGGAASFSFAQVRDCFRAPD